MKKKFSVAVAAALALTGVAMTDPANAAVRPREEVPSVSISWVFVDSPGVDDRSNTSLNAEWIRITNNSTAKVNLKYWRLSDRDGHTYTFRAFFLDVGRSLTVRTGSGTNGDPVNQHYWNSPRYIWDNNGDTATLKNSAGKTVDKCAWKRTTAIYC